MKIFYNEPNIKNVLTTWTYYVNFATDKLYKHHYVYIYIFEFQNFNKVACLSIPYGVWMLETSKVLLHDMFIQCFHILL